MKKMGKTLLAVTLGLTVALGAWGNGQAEGNQSTFVKFPDGASSSLSYRKIGSLVEVNFPTPKLASGQGALVKTWILTNVDDAPKTGTNFVCYDGVGNQVIFSNSQDSGAINLLAGNFDPPANQSIASSFVKMGSSSDATDIKESSFNLGSFLESNHLTDPREKSSDPIRIFLRQDGAPHRYQFRIIGRIQKSNAFFYHVWKLQVDQSVQETRYFFEGEDDLLGTSPTEVQKLALLSLLIADGDTPVGDSKITDFVQANSSVSLNDIQKNRTDLWNLVKKSLNPEKVPVVLEKLRSTMYSMLGTRLDEKGVFFDSPILHQILYGGQQNTYLSGLLRYYFNSDYGTGVFRTLVMSQLARSNVSPSRMKRMDSTTAQIMAKKALDYLTGAVDYTQADNAFYLLSHLSGMKPSLDFKWAEGVRSTIPSVTTSLFPLPSQNLAYTIDWRRRDLGGYLGRVAIYTSPSVSVGQASVNGVTINDLLEYKPGTSASLQTGGSITLSFSSLSRVSCIQLVKGSGPTPQPAELSLIGTINGVPNSIPINFHPYGERGYDSQKKKWIEFASKTGLNKISGNTLGNPQMSETFLYLNSPTSLNTLTIRVNSGKFNLKAIKVFSGDPLQYLTGKETSAQNGTKEISDNESKPLLIMAGAGETYNFSLDRLLNENVGSLNQESIQEPAQVWYPNILDPPPLVWAEARLGRQPFDSAQAISSTTRAAVSLNFRNWGFSSDVKERLINAGVDSARLFSSYSVSSSMPVAYAAGGIEIPETFNQKVWNSFLFWKNKGILRENLVVYPPTNELSSLGNRPLDGNGKYLTTPTIDDSVVETFSKNGYPYVIGNGVMKDVSIQENSPYQISKKAGTDSWGLLTGALYLTYRDRSISQKPFGYLGSERNILSTASDYLTGMRSAFDAQTLTASKAKLFSYFGSGFPQNGSIWNRLDLEAMTTIVPSMNDIAVGDLIVGDERGQPKLGIVVRLLAPDGSRVKGANEPVTTKEQVVLVTSDLEIGAVHLALWGNGEGNGGFSAHPENYTIRRILVDNVSNPTTQIALSDDVLDPQKLSWLVHYSAFDQTTGNDPAWARWIPNTGELHSLGKISLKQGGLIPKQWKDAYVDVVKPEDRGYSTEPANMTAGNVYNNKGSTFYLIGLNNTLGQENGYGIPADTHFEKPDGVFLTNYKLTAYLVAKFESEPNANSPERHYRVTMGSGYLQIGADGNLKYMIGGKPLTDFALWVPENSGIPGDDLVLRFSKPTWIKSPNGSILDADVAVASRSEYFAVYDKKLLWRANLYIKDDSNDWNSKHPWITSNEWNRSFGGSVDDAIKLLSAGSRTMDAFPVGDGRQVVSKFLPWTRYNGGFPNSPHSTMFKSNTDMAVSNASAYTSGTDDSPFDFLRKIAEQKAYTAALYNSKIKEAVEKPGSVFSGLTASQKSEVIGYMKLGYRDTGKKSSDAATFSYLTKEMKQALAAVSLPGGIPTDTSAPGGVWQNYYPQNWTTVQAKSDYDALQPIEGYHPYRPVYSAIEKFEFEHDVAVSLLVSAGNDCNGFITRILKYSGSRYRIEDRGENFVGWSKGYNYEAIITLASNMLWSDSTKDFTIPITSSDKKYSEEIFSITIDSSQNTVQDYWNSDTRSNVLSGNLVPGDIISVYTPSGGTRETPKYGHIMMVGSIDGNADEGGVDSRKITIVESASGNNNPPLSSNLASDPAIATGGNLNNGKVDTVGGGIDGYGGVARWYRVLNKDLLSSYLHNSWYGNNTLKFFRMIAR